MAIEVRAEAGDADPGEARAVDAVLAAAFETRLEADLVAAIRRRLGAEACVSWLAIVDGRPVGHVLFTPAQVGEGRGPVVWTLGPMAVHPEHQREGVGAALVEAGLAACRARGVAAVFVLGHPGYYPRFGFVPAPPLGFTCRWDVPPEAFMVRELQPGALAGRSGRVTYVAELEAL